MPELTPADLGIQQACAEALTLDAGFGSAAVRNRDALDFHEIAVTTMMRSLKDAWLDGFRAASPDGGSPRASEPLLDALRDLVAWHDQDKDGRFLEAALHTARGLIARAEGV